MKNLEDEYKSSQKEEMPDLWNRIEAGLPEKKKPVFFMSANKYLGIAAAAAVLFLVVSAGLWSGRQLSKNNTSNLAMQNGAAAPPVDNADDVYENKDTSGEEAYEEGMWAEEAEDYEMAEEPLGQQTEQNGASYSPIMQDGGSHSDVQEDISESAGSGNAQTAVGGMPVEDAETGTTTALSEVEALALLGAYLTETGVLPEERKTYGTEAGERPGYTWEAISENSGEPVRMFLKFVSWSEDGGHLIFGMGEQTESGEEGPIQRTYTVQSLTGAIAEE